MINDPVCGQVCDCPCHKEGYDMMHFMPCCELCGLKYIDEHDIPDHGKIFELYRSHGLKWNDGTEMVLKG